MLRAPTARTVGALALLLVAGCFFQAPEPEPFMVFAGPTAFLGFELRDAEQVLWRLSAEEPVPLSALFYGRVPAGFRQEVPVGGAPPRPLLDGEPLSMRSLTELRIFRHEGFARGDVLTILGWEMRLRREPSPPLDGGEDGP